jgi:ankyrin repeat protein
MARVILSLGAACSLVAGHPDVLPPLSAAARAGDLAALRALLNAGADPNAGGEGGSGWPPLMHAVHTQQFDAARLLLDRGADPNLGLRGYTPLMMAAAEPDSSMLILLLDYGADPYAHGPGGMSALTLAIACGAGNDVAGGSHATLTALLTRASDLRQASTPAGREARFWAAIHARVQQVHHIASGPSRGTPAPTSCDASLVAARKR